MNDYLPALSRAIDEIYLLRAALAEEADTLRAHLDYKTFPKTRRGIAEGQVERMGRFARGELFDPTRDGFNEPLALLRVGAEPTLTNQQWLASRGLRSNGEATS